MNTLRLSLPANVLFITVFWLSACAGPPGNNPLVDASRSAYDAAARTADVVSYAPEVLKEARADLERSERLLAEGEERETVEHYAYLAKQRVAIALETTNLKRSELTIEQAETERTAVQLEARTAEAKANQEEADRNANAARLAREQTTRALERATELAGRIAELEAQQTARGLVLTLSDVLFDVGKADLKSGANRAVGELSAFLAEYTNRNIIIEGFTDDTGSKELNQNLSSRRSSAVKTALVARGVDASRIQTQGYGESYPRASNRTATGRQQNRRVEIVISDDSGVIPVRTN